MAETYCGKNCSECGRKETLNCPGCKAGPGRRYDGDCKIAKCCMEKGHQECSTCSLRGHCGTYHSKEDMPERRIRNMEAEKARAAAVAKRAPVLGKWLWILFWLIIPSTIASVMSNENLAGSDSTVYVCGQALRAICSFAYGIILFRIRSEEEHYRTAAICALIGGAVGILTACIPRSTDMFASVLLISVPTVIVSLVGEYSEFTAHSAVLTGVDNELSEKWSVLWKWYIGSYGAMIGSLLIIVIIPVLSLLVTLAAAIGVFVVSILKLIYLYRTAKAFREYIPL